MQAVRTLWPFYLASLAVLLLVIFVPALSLTGVEALDAPPSLILPAGWYKPKRMIDAYVDSMARVRLIGVLERGSDFERVAYETV